MSSGTAAQGREQVAVAAEEGLGLAAESDGLGAVEAVGAAGAGAARAAGGGAGSRALPAVEAAAAVAHGGLPAGAVAAGARLRPAARRFHVVAGRVAVPKPAAIAAGIGRSCGSQRQVMSDHGVACVERSEQNMNIFRDRLVVKCVSNCL